jgi:6-phosphogluconolactonase
MTGDLVFVGTYTEPIRFGTGQILQGKGGGIHAFRFDRAAGALHPLTVAAGVRNPSYLAFHPSLPVLYAVNEFKEYQGAASGAVSAFRLDPDTGALTLLSIQASHGTDPCHLTVDATGRYVLVANFASGGVCVLPVAADGSLGEASQVIKHAGSSIHPVRQAGPHAHAVTLDATNRFAFVPDLGLDQLVIYRFDAATGRLTPNDPQPLVATAPGAGPRQIALHPSARFAYLINELDSTVTAFAWDAARGMLDALATYPTLPAGHTGRSTCAEIQVTPDGTLLYGSNRGHDSVVIFAIDPGAGTLTAIGHHATGGRIPRNFDIDPRGDFLLAANQDSDNVVPFRIDRASGALTETGRVTSVGTPVCVRFYGAGRTART